MRVLILGHSRIVQRRVLPALSSLSTVSAIDIASRRAIDTRTIPAALRGDMFNDYGTALDAERAALVYISTVNSEHAVWARRALERGHHVVVDKPACLRSTEARELVDFANARNLCLAEATVWPFHPQISAALELFGSEDGPKRAAACFSFPPPSAEDFRYRRDLGGGALSDLGPYAVSIGRIAFATDPKRISCFVNTWGGVDRLETSFSVLIGYDGGRSFVGHFGFDTSYKNNLLLLGDRVGVEIDRAFTTPPDLSNSLRLSRGSALEQCVVDPADAFIHFLDAVIASIARGDHRRLATALMRDAEVLDRLRTAAFRE